ncbi:arginase family protein [Streptosporangium sandarakinum]|uniref:Arginase n=1 Tax=Streptosporangium sandarakinum TaxID=1260955 RepID=A0A852V5I8_9ACTN|nr:arginase family protein [Streptosporangium sandarakinum]NYF41581.1 arginase [Streptosporangium sandarakinum]
MAAAVEVIAAPWNLGLRPPAPGREPGTWRAPRALLSAGLEARLRPARVVELARPPYEFDAQPATRVRNGVTIREHALRLGEAVQAALAASRFAVVLGGDCSILLGCLLGARRDGRCGLVHLDGHSDFRHPGNYDAGSSLGSAAGMDLALATGRGELLLTHWPVVGRPLVADEDVIQIGDREDAGMPPVTRFTAQQIQRIGIADLGGRIITHLERRGLDRAWLHLDLDVLDERVLPAVDSPGRPGLDFSQLAELVSTLVGTGRVVGLDVAIYDPERDPDGVYAAPIVDCLASALTPLATVEAHA